MSLNNDTLNLPWRIYFFGKDGKYDKSDVRTCRDINTFKMFHKKMKAHNDLELEIRVCDSDDTCIMHWVKGERIYPK